MKYRANRGHKKEDDQKAALFFLLLSYDVSIGNRVYTAFQRSFVVFHVSIFGKFSKADLRFLHASSIDNSIVFVLFSALYNYTLYTFSHILCVNRFLSCQNCVLVVIFKVKKLRPACSVIKMYRLDVKRAFITGLNLSIFDPGV